MTDAVAERGRRLFLTGAAAASGMLLMGHSPYRRWSQYRALHTVIATDRTDAGSFPLGERLAAHLGARSPALKPVAGRAESAATVLSLLKTGQLDLGLLRSEDAYHAVHGDRSRSDTATPLRALTVLAPEYLYVIVMASSPVRMLTDLRGTRVGIVDTSGRAGIRARRLVTAAGFDADRDVRWMSVAAAEAATALSRGAFDAGVLESHSLAPGAALAPSPGLRLRLVPHGDVASELVARHGPVYFPAVPLAGPDGLVAVDGPVLGEARLLVCRADYPPERSRAIAEALRGWSEVAPADTPLPIPRHAALADPDTPT
ncbi:MAG: TAXI family TRAP transporter solute-binding subunit [Gaiellales bacterium]